MCVRRTEGLSLTPTSSFFAATGPVPGRANDALSSDNGDLGLFAALLQLVTGETRSPVGGGPSPLELATLTGLATGEAPGLAGPGDDDPLSALIDALDAIEIALKDELQDPSMQQRLAELSVALGLPASIVAAAEALGSAPDGLAGTTPGGHRNVLPEARSAPPDHSPKMQHLIERLDRLARSLDAAAPALAERLRAFSDAAARGEPDAATLANLLRSAEAAIRSGSPSVQIIPPAPPQAVPPLAEPSLETPRLGASGVTDRPAAFAPSEGDSGRPAISAARTGQADVATLNGATAGSSPDPGSPAPEPAAATATSGATSIEGKAAQAAYAAPTRQINLPQVAFEIVRQVQAGNSRFQIRLDPPELGRIDVKLDMDANGGVNARLTVERAETLDLMQRDQRALERALAQAGLDSSKTNLEFSLRQNLAGQQEHSRQGFGHDGGQGWRGPAPVASAETSPPLTLTYRGAASTGVDLIV